MFRSNLMLAIVVGLALSLLTMCGENVKASEEGMPSFTDSDLLRTGHALSNAYTLLAPLRDPGQNVTVYITDFGINQCKIMVRVRPVASQGDKFGAQRECEEALKVNPEVSRMLNENK